MIRPIPSDASFTAGSSGAGLIDLRNYFSDDHGILRFDVVYEENPDYLHAALAADGHHLDFAAGPGWFGSARFQVAVTDGVPGHARVLSNTFTAMVNALPWFTSQPPAQVRAGERLLYQVTVADPYPTDDPHTFSLLQAPAGMTIDGMTGLVEWTPTASDAGAHAVRVKVVDSRGGAAEQSFSVEVVVAPAPPPTTAVVVATTLGAVGVLGAAAIASENVKYSLLMIFIPLYSKIKREQVLDHFVRGQIYGYVLANPGEHYNAIKVALGLTNGSLAHHLKTLEREQFLKSKRFGLYRRFYPMNMRIPEDGFFAPNEIQKTIVDIIRTNPGITQKEIALHLGLTPPTVNYHISILREHRAIRVERAGRKTHCFVADAEPTDAPTGPEGGPSSGTPRPGAPRP
jgi:DNA-binding MarR family transcriptional regulator